MYTHVYTICVEVQEGVLDAPPAVFVSLPLMMI